MKIISLGEILWDVFPDAEHLGGAPFNFAAHAHRLGHEVLFVSAVGDDERGHKALARAEELGLSTRFVRCLAGEATGTVSVKLDSSGQPQFTIHRPAAYDRVMLGAAELAGLSSPSADWIAFGTLHQTSSHAREALQALLRANPRAWRFYDVNLRKDCYDTPLVRNLLECASVVKLNDAEVRAVEEMLGQAASSLEEFARKNIEAYGWEALCITRGAEGCALLVGDEYVEAGAYPVEVADAVGAGDAFAAAFLHSLSLGWPAAKIADFANRLGALVASRPGAIPPWTLEECRAL